MHKSDVVKRISKQCHLHDIALDAVDSGDNTAKATGDLNGGLVTLHFAHLVEGVNLISLLQDEGIKKNENVLSI